MESKWWWAMGWLVRPPQMRADGLNGSSFPVGPWPDPSSGADALLPEYALLRTSGAAASTADKMADPNMRGNPVPAMDVNAPMFDFMADFGRGLDAVRAHDARLAQAILSPSS